MIRFLRVAVLGAALAGCVVPERGLTLSEVRDLRIVDVIVETPKPGEGGQSPIVWPGVSLAYAGTLMPASSRPVAMGRDPTGASSSPSAEEAAWDAKFTALSKSAAAQAHTHSTLAQVVRESFRKRFTEQPAGKHGARLKITIKSLIVTGSQANFTADVVVLDGVTGRPLTRYADLSGVRAASTAVVPASPVGILVGIAVLTIADSIRGDPAHEAIDSASSSFSGWFLRE